MANVASAAEVAAAQAFLRKLGAPWQNNYLVVAVVAWMRQESGGLKSVLGNNPFNLRPGKDIAAYQSGVRKSRNGNGYFAVFATLEDGLIATAARLLKAGNDWRGYGLVVRAARNGQAVDFLTAIALSAWDAAHYGLPEDNHLLRVYASFTGLQLPPPKPPKAKNRTSAPKVRAKPRTELKPPVARTYLDGFETRSFYDARHRRDPEVQ